ncbi:MAG TPA: magnesium transporter [Casimicrobiaceae bacterium]|nr:magnesium transporter [Casimicrobiaceae bacterium]
MSETLDEKPADRSEGHARVEDALVDVTALLRKNRLVEGLVHEQAVHTRDAGEPFVESQVTRQNRALLQRRLDHLHPADIAYILEALPQDERLYIWDLVKAERDGEILIEVSDAVRESLIDSMDTDELVAAAETLETDELAQIADDLPQEVIDDVFQRMPVHEREELRAAMSYEEDMVGALMDFEDVHVRPDATLEAVLRYLRRFDELPSQTDQLFVVDRDENLLGVLPINALIVKDPQRRVEDVMLPAQVALFQHEKAQTAAHAFERYDLVSAPVVDTNNKLVGRVTVDSVLDFVRERGHEEMLAQAGLAEQEDVFASVWRSFRNRWAWLAINLVTAFIASRVIGVFEGTIEKLVALAALMPIVAGIGGNAGNQTITMLVRAVALGHVGAEHGRKLIRKELQVALLNGLVWGGVMGLVAMLLYRDVQLGLVMVLAMTLNLGLAAIAGVLIPMTMLRFGRDPAVGSSVLITAVTDSGGFFIFLGLATLFLVSR